MNFFLFSNWPLKASRFQCDVQIGKLNSAWVERRELPKKIFKDNFLVIKIMWGLCIVVWRHRSLWGSVDELLAGLALARRIHRFLVAYGTAATASVAAPLALALGRRTIRGCICCRAAGSCWCRLWWWLWLLSWLLICVHVYCCGSCGVVHSVVVGGAGSSVVRVVSVSCKNEMS